MTMSQTPMYEIRPVKKVDVTQLFLDHHGYKSVPGTATYCFAAFEGEKMIAAWTWQPPPHGAAKKVCPEAPQGVLALSRMVAVPKAERPTMPHISEPLRCIMDHMINRGRWPVLVTYSDQGQNHTGTVYAKSGWKKTEKNRRGFATVDGTAEGARVSLLSCGKRSKYNITGYTILQRWEDWIRKPGRVAQWMLDNGWRREERWKTKINDQGERERVRVTWASTRPAWIFNYYPKLDKTNKVNV